jgi:aryl-alcohol dehydrogenase-like predicted oxidoreductase
MEAKKLAGTGFDISELALGCMSFTDPSEGPHGSALGVDDAGPHDERRRLRRVRHHHLSGR